MKTLYVTSFILLVLLFSSLRAEEGDYFWGRFIDEGTVIVIAGALFDPNVKEREEIPGEKEGLIRQAGFFRKTVMRVDRILYVGEKVNRNISITQNPQNINVILQAVKDGTDVINLEETGDGIFIICESDHNFFRVLDRAEKAKLLKFLQQKSRDLFRKSQSLAESAQAIGALGD